MSNQKSLRKILNRKLRQTAFGFLCKVVETSSSSIFPLFNTPESCKMFFYTDNFRSAVSTPIRYSFREGLEKWLHFVFIPDIDVIAFNQLRSPEQDTDNMCKSATNYNMQAEVEAMLSRLPEEYRHIWRLYLSGTCYKKISLVTEFSEDIVRWRIYIVRKRAWRQQTG